MIPVSTTVGWELEIEGQVVEVTSVQPASGEQPETLTVVDSSGTSSTFEVMREDTPDNTVDYEGTAVESEEEQTALPAEAPPPSSSGCAIVGVSRSGGRMALAGVGFLALCRLRARRCPSSPA